MKRLEDGRRRGRLANKAGERIDLGMRGSCGGNTSRRVI